MPYFTVYYSINKLAGSGRVSMSEKRSIRDDFESEKDDETGLMTETKTKVSRYEGIPQNEIKILGFSE
jgi:hypothetical protein